MTTMGIPTTDRDPFMGVAVCRLRIPQEPENIKYKHYINTTKTYIQKNENKKNIRGKHYVRRGGGG